MRGRLRSPGPVAATALAAGIALRLFVYRSDLGTPDSDEAVVGLMARHVLHGQLTTFFWGQGYGGSQEALLTAPLFAVAGTSLLALRIVPMLLQALTAVLVWRVGLRLFGDSRAVLAGAVFWVWPPFLVYKLTHQWGFYASGVLYAALLLLLALRIAERPEVRRVVVFGGVAGVALWEDTQLVPIVAALVLWLAWRRPAAFRLWWAAVLPALVGALPWFLWNAHHGFASFQTHIAAQSSYAHRLRIFASPLLPMLLGLRTSFSQTPLGAGAIADLAYLALVGAFLVFAWRARRDARSALAVVALVFPFVYALAPQTLASDSPGYLLVLSPVLALLVAGLGRSRTARYGVLAVAGALSAVGLVRMDHTTHVTDPSPAIAPRDLGPLIRELDGAHVDRVYAQYWVAYRLDFDTHERIVAAESKLKALRPGGGEPRPTPNPVIRWPAYEREVDSAPRAAFLFIDWPGDRNRRARLHVMAQLARRGFRRWDYKNLILYLPSSA